MKNLPISTLLGVAATTGIALVTTPAQATDLSFTGSIGTNPDTIQSFFFTANGSVTIRSYGWGGGTNAQGTAIVSGGFDPVLTLFDADTGAYILDRDDDIGLDFNLVENLTGNYRAVLSVQGNNANGAFPGGNFADGFTADTPGNGTSFFGRTPAYAIDILNVNNITTTAVPEPFTLVGTLIGGTVALRMRKKLSANMSNNSIDR
jgi:hypothetical protein